MIEYNFYISLIFNLQQKEHSNRILTGLWSWPPDGSSRGLGPGVLVQGVGTRAMWWGLYGEGQTVKLGNGHMGPPLCEQTDTHDWVCL